MISDVELRPRDAHLGHVDPNEARFDEQRVRAERRDLDPRGPLPERRERGVEERRDARRVRRRVVEVERSRGRAGVRADEPGREHATGREEGGGIDRRTSLVGVRGRRAEHEPERRDDDENPSPDRRLRSIAVVTSTRLSALATRLLVAFSLLAAIAAGCDKTPSTVDAGAPPAASIQIPITAWEPATRDAAIADGRAVLEKHQCTRCHTIDDLPAAARPLGCTACHIFLSGLKPEEKARKALVEKYGEPIVARYQHNIRHLIQVPSLTGIARRVQPAFLASFLREPQDLRPALEESMIRHKLSEAEIRAVVRYLAARGEADDPFAPNAVQGALPPRPSDARIERGKAIFLGRGCVACHTFGNLDTGVSREKLVAAGVAAELAPNLRFVRERTRPEALVAWIVDPQRVAPGTLMPALGLSREDAELVRDFLLFGDPHVAPMPAPIEPRLPPLLERPVAYGEMKERVLGRVCVHCHMNDYEKDPGPGNRGGLGYGGIRLQMRTYETLVAGAVDEKGERYSVLAPRKGETVAPILQAMLRRRVEEQRDHVEAFADHERPPYPKGLVGMPLGLPSMSDEELAILATWIAQGCKGPTEITGKPGVDDGYLVPDGPAAKNAGCELRAVPAARPSWAIDGAAGHAAK